MSTTLSRRRLLCLLATPAAGMVRPVLAQDSTAAIKPPAELAAALPAARLQGSHRFRFFFVHVYDIRLWVGERSATAANWAEAPLALEIVYARDLEGRAIAERSLQEMRRQGDIAPDQAERWLAAMTAAFPNVGDGDRLTGLHLPGSGTRFFFNGQPRSEVSEAAFARRFLGIWLAPQTSEPAMRDALLANA